jgi:hypothetical protein
MDHIVTENLNIKENEIFIKNKKDTNFYSEIKEENPKPENFDINYKSKLILNINKINQNPNSNQYTNPNINSYPNKTFLPLQIDPIIISSPNYNSTNTNTNIFSNKSKNINSDLNKNTIGYSNTNTKLFIKENKYELDEKIKFLKNIPNKLTERTTTKEINNIKQSIEDIENDKFIFEKEKEEKENKNNRKSEKEIKEEINEIKQKYYLNIDIIRKKDLFDIYEMSNFKKFLKIFYRIFYYFFALS